MRTHVTDITEWCSIFALHPRFQRLGSACGAACRLDGMRLTEFRQLVDDEFGPDRAGWIIQSQVLTGEGETAAEMIENGVDPKEAWARLCDAFDIPEARRLGVDRPGT